MTKKHIVIETKSPDLKGDTLRKKIKEIINTKELGIQIEKVNAKTPSKIVLHFKDESSRKILETNLKEKIKEKSIEMEVKEYLGLNPRTIIFNVPEDSNKEESLAELKAVSPSENDKIKSFK